MKLNPCVKSIWPSVGLEWRKQFLLPFQQDKYNLQHHEIWPCNISSSFDLFSPISNPSSKHTYSLKPGSADLLPIKVCKTVMWWFHLLITCDLICSLLFICSDCIVFDSGTVWVMEERSSSWVKWERPFNLCFSKQFAANLRPFGWNIKLRNSHLWSLTIPWSFCGDKGC